MVLELLEANTVLLILDNFETVPLDEVDALLEFFDNKVKKHLRKYPYNFKVIITSRRQMPSGLHQIKLGGLNHNDAMELIENILENYQDSGKEISKAQCEMIIEASAGIPIVIKHLFAMIFEHNKPIGQVIRALSNYKHELIQFSFKELLSAIESQDNKIQLKIIALLEIINMPLMIRQISDILDADEFEIEESIIELTNYLCISRTFTDRHEKYAINAEINHLSKALVLEHPDLTTEIRDNITNNFTIDKTLDYTNEEIMIVGFFTKFIQDENYLEAEDYIKSKINEYPDSNIIKLHYAHYLRKYMNDSRKAIGLYEDLQEKIGSHKSVVQGIFSCHLHDEIPNFEKTHIYARELEKYSDEDEDLKIELGEFYLRWSSTLKEKLGSSTVTERMRQENYKKLAMKAYDIIDTVKKQDHKTYYLLSHCQYNLWDYKRSLRLINKAISLTYRIKREAFHSYFEFRKIIISKMKRHSRRDYDSIQDFHTY